MQTPKESRSGVALRGLHPEERFGKQHCAALAAQAPHLPPSQPRCARLGRLSSPFRRLAGSLSVQCFARLRRGRPEAQKVVTSPLPRCFVDRPE